jgi:hypothetical protein
MGLRDEELRRISVPTAIVPYYDWMHLHTSATHALKMIPGSRLFDYEPTRRGMLSRLPKRIRRIVGISIDADPSREAATVRRSFAISSVA